MSKFVEVKTAELVGQVLDWAVAQVEGVPCYTCPNSPQKTQFVDDEDCPFGRYIYSPRQNWDQGGPLIEKYDVRLNKTTDGKWYASTDGYIMGANPSGISRSALIALCRAIVGSRMGDVVQVPVELVGVAA